MDKLIILLLSLLFLCPIYAQQGPVVNGHPLDQRYVYIENNFLRNDLLSAVLNVLERAELY